MAFLENLVDGMAIAKEKLTDTATVIQEKNKKLSQMRKLRSIMKRENEIMSEAYESLGKIFYNKMNDKEKEEFSAFCNIIESSKKTMENAHMAYVAIQNGTNVQYVKTKGDGVTVVCSNEDEYKEPVAEKTATYNEEVADEDLF